jgi:sporulation protein YlmC with PRC-barrel domain
MLKRHLALGLLGSALIAAPALAQTTPAPVPANPAPPPASTQAAPMTTGQGGAMNFVEVRPQDQFRASKLIGTLVIGANNESIGEINDVLMDQNGRAHAVIIGVGGFLGIGEKDVAIPMTAIQFSAGNMDMAQRGATTTGAVTPPAAPATTSAPVPANNNSNLSANAPAAGTTPPTTSTATADMDDGVPNRIVLSMTKEQLTQAPTFRDNPNAQRGIDSTTAPANPSAPATTPRP